MLICDFSFRLVPLLLLCLLLGVAQPAALRAQDDEADHDALRELRAVAEQAINENQLELLKPYLAENFSVVTYTDREFTNFDEFKSRWNKTREEMLRGGSYTTDLRPKRSLIIGDIAVCRGNSENVLITGDGTTYQFRSRWSAVCRKVDGQWKIVRAHSSLNPFDNPMLTAGVQSAITKIGLVIAPIGLLIGGVLGFLLGLRRGRIKGAAETRQE